MPWSRLALPPLFGELYALDPAALVVWGEHGLLRIELDTHPALRLLHAPEMVARRFDPAAGTVTWTGTTFRLVGDPARVPTPAPPLTPPDQLLVRLELDPAARRVVVSGDAPDSRHAVEGFPPAGAAWHVAAALPRERRFVLASSEGLAVYAYRPPPPPPEPGYADVWQARGGAADHAALLAAVVADADSDTPRLVYADYLEERGDEADAARAEFIRLQCRIAGRQRAGRVEPADPDMARALELARRHQPAWRGRVPAVAGVTWDYADRLGHLAAWRGFPRASVTSVATWQKMRARLGAVSPLECVGLNHIDAGDVAALARSDHFGRVRVFESLLGERTVYYATPAERAAKLRDLLAAPEARRWRGLALSAAEPEVLAALAGAAGLESLEWLRFGQGVGAREQYRPLLDSPHLPRLAWVEFRAWDESQRAEQRRLDALFAARRPG